MPINPLKRRNLLRKRTNSLSLEKKPKKIKQGVLRRVLRMANWQASKTDKLHGRFERK